MREPVARSAARAGWNHRRQGKGGRAGDCGNGADELNLLETGRLGSHVPLAVRHQHDFAEHAAFAQHLVRAARLFERQPLCDQRLDLALLEQIQQR